jgi:hypothetical protein
MNTTPSRSTHVRSDHGAAMQMHEPGTVKWLTILLLSTFSLVFSFPAFCQGPIHIPGPGEGYQISPSNDTHQDPPPGYEGRTDYSSRTAIGNTPATNGKKVVSHFTFGNLVQTCPDADGTVEGTGQFLVSIEYSDTQPTRTTTQHLEVSAQAKYKGQVGDNALLTGPVKAEIDYSYTSSGRTRESNGAITTPSPTNIQQHITIPFTVAGLRSPDIGAFSGGDPTQGHYADAVMVGTALTYWAGIYYGVAQIKWYGGESSSGGISMSGGQCAHIAFDPPSYTLQPPLGTQVKVKAMVQTRAGKNVKANFLEAVAPRNAGSVTPGGGASDAGRPIEFTYMAPAQPIKRAGFHAAATSRAGVATGEWLTGLGSGWSGEITYVLNQHDQQPETDMGGFSTEESMQFTVNVKDGVGTATSHADKKSNSISRQKALRGGAITLITIATETANGSADGSSPAQVQVNIDRNKGTYSITPSWLPATGKLHHISCQRGVCEASDQPYGATPTMYTGIDGKLSDPNHLSGSKTDQSQLGSRGTGRRTWTVTWNLARSGSK